MSEHEIRIPPKLIPVFQGEADVRYSFGGRGSAKTRSFATMAANTGVRFGQAGISGQILCCRQFMNSLEDSSLEEVKRAIEDCPMLSAYYEVGEKYIKSKDGRISFTFAGLDRSINSIKSKGRILLCWVDEAEPVTDTAWAILIPTLREEGDGWNAELWVTWNPMRETASVETRFRNSDDPRIKGAEMNWRDNPKFPAKLERDRQRDMAERPEQYNWIWEGAFLKVVAGSYYAADLNRAQQEGRIGFVALDPLMATRAYWDIGGTGGNADACAIWIAQFIGTEARVLDYYETSGQPLAAHVEWLHSLPKKPQIILPHDGDQHDKIQKVTYASSLREAGFDVRVVKNMGKGAAMKRVEASRRVFPAIRFNEQTTEAGRTALGFYHAKIDEKRGHDMGPAHDWSSHGADAFGLMCVDYLDRPAVTNNRINYPTLRR